MGSFGEYGFFVVTDGRENSDEATEGRGKERRSDPDCIGTGCATEERGKQRRSDEGDWQSDGWFGERR